MPKANNNRIPDISTGWEGYSGNSVENFIKDTFAAKYGYSRIAENKFLQQFASEQDALLYDTDPDRYGDLLLSTLVLPNTGATVALMRVTMSKKPAEYTTPGTPVVARFRYLSYYDTETDLSPVKGVATVSVNGTQRMTMELRSGNTYEIDLTKYLTLEKNEITITIENNEGSRRNFVYDVAIVNLQVTSSFDDTAAYSGVIPFRFTPIGDIEKTIHLLLDGKEIYKEKTDVNNRQMSYDIPAQRHGAHRIKLYLSAVINGLTIQSEPLLMDVICIEEGNTRPIIATTFSGTTARQYDTVTIPFCVYDPAGSPTQISLYVAGKKIADRNVDRTLQTWTYKILTKGTLALSIKCGAVSRDFSLKVTQSAVSAQAETRNLDLWLTSIGRSNADSDRAQWKSGDITAKMTGFNFVSDGWMPDKDGAVALHVSGHAAVEIPVFPFAGSPQSTGKTIEIEFCMSSVTDYSANVISCMYAGVGFNITPDTILLKSEQSAVDSHYKHGERVRLSFVIQKQAADRLIQVYVNGIKSRSVQYPASDGFAQRNPVGISIGAPYTEIDIYNIRVYSNDLTAAQILDNMISDMDDVDKKLLVFNRNKIYDSKGSISLNAVNALIPVLTITGDLPNYKGDKKSVDISFRDLADPSRSFSASGCKLDVQGTSSQFYPRKNFKFSAANGFELSSGHLDKYTLNQKECAATDIFCLKADFAESSGTHNTGIANYIEYLLDASGFADYVQNMSKAETRSVIYGEPCVVYQRKNADSQPVFIGKYNFNIDKSALEPVFPGNQPLVCVEFLNNTSDRSLFKSADFSGDDWKNDFEQRWDGGAGDEELKLSLQNLFAWIVACKGNPDKFKSELDGFFQKDPLIFYYLISLVFGMVDQRAKNMFLTSRNGKNDWFFIFYDNDTCLGLNNEGEISFPYDIEIHDVIGSQNVWNGADSQLWLLVEQAFPDEIARMYRDMRQQGILSYENLIKFLNEAQSERWPEAVYNEDGYYKYESPLIDGFEDWSSGTPVLTKTGAFLYALQGSRDAHRRWWAYNRFRYLDSKYQAGAALNDTATFRTYTPAKWAGVRPCADITVTAAEALFSTVKWGSVSKTQRLSLGETYTFRAPDGMQFNDTETIIYDASRISSLGDLSPLYPGTVDVSRMTALTELIIGNSASGYNNTNFKVLSVGTNKVLRKLVLTGCSEFSQPIDVSRCPAIEEIYADRTKTTAVILPDGGVLSKLVLPDTITNLTIRNQPLLRDSGLTIADFSNVTALTVEDSPGVDGYALAVKCIDAGDSLQRVRLIGIDADAPSLDVLEILCGLGGLDESGAVTSHAVVTGSIHVPEISEDHILKYAERFPNLTITYDTFLTIPTRIIKVAGENGKPLPGVKVTVNGKSMTTDTDGSVSVVSADRLSVTVEHELIETTSYTFASTYRPFTYTLSPNLLFYRNYIVKDKNDYVLKGAVLKIGGKEYVTDYKNLLALRNIEYDYSIIWQGVETKGKITHSGEWNTNPTSSSVTIYTQNYTDLEKLRPRKNGNIQMLLNRAYAGTVFSININFKELGSSIDWGDGNVSYPTSDDINKVTKFTSTSQITGLCQVRIDNPQNIESISFVAKDPVIAIWSMGESSAYINCSGCSYLRIVCADLLSYGNLNNYGSFSGCYTLKSVPSGIFDTFSAKTDFSYMFNNCSALSQIPEDLFALCSSVRSFESAFSSCRSMKTIPESLFYSTLHVYTMKYAFQSCTALTSIPESLLSKLNNLENVYGLFMSCSSIIDIPENLFANNKKLLNVNACFYGCEKISTVPQGLFSNCDKIYYFESIFYRCNSLRFFPDGVIGNSLASSVYVKEAFRSCTKLEVAWFPDFPNSSRIYVGSMFYDCSSLKAVLVKSNTPQNISGTLFNDGTPDAKIYVPDDAVDAYKSAAGWKTYADIILPMSSYIPPEGLS